MRWLTGFGSWINNSWGVIVYIVITFSLSVNAAQDWPNYPGSNDDLSIKTDPLKKSDGGEKGTSEIHMNMADEFHSALSMSIDGTVDWIDSFFRDERTEVEEANSSLRLKLSGFAESSKEIDYKVKARLHLVLPYLEKKLHLFASSIFEEDEEEIDYLAPTDVEDDASRNFYLSMRYFFKAAEKRNFSLRAGLKFHGFSPALFTGPRYRFSKKWNAWNFRLIESLTYFSDNGYESKTTADIEKLISDFIFYRARFSGIWKESERGYAYWLDTDFYLTLSYNKAINYRIRGTFNTHPNNKLTDVLIGARYRQRLWRKWLFFEISPQVVFRREEDFKYYPGITLSIEAFFGEDLIEGAITRLID